ncbi:MFS family permease [Catenuloplanes atrovinosus]|uniref:MFS family permease n=2 Tax=Catenuloplanes atrovinosus TaxID=137266 RepID=A0AAE3YPD1_9ACTN|nr:MFS transporter [Catenuloplanes atrovinosus]MDR7276190.1 MFS family permease [Catenuloplanes atrovinosus]
MKKARLATALLFLLYGTLIGVWTARIPAVKEHLGLSDGLLSLALLALAAGAITGMQLVGTLVDRFGTRRVLTPVALADGFLLIPVALAPNLATLALALFAFGVVHGTLNVAMNARGVEIERAWGSPIMSSFHAAYSIGGFLGAAAGGAFAAAGAGPVVTFASVAVVMAAVTAWAVAQSFEATREHPATEVRQNPGPLRGVLLLGGLAFCALIGEGAAADWSTVYVRDSLGGSAALAAGAYAAFFAAMTAGRLAGDPLTARFGPVAVVRAGGLLAAGGLGAALLVHHPIAGVIGFGCLGAGLSTIAPQVFSAAGARNPDRPARAIARAASIGWLGFFAGPVLIGGGAALTGLPVALAIPVVLAAVIVVAARAVDVRSSGVPVAAAGR